MSDRRPAHWLVLAIALAITGAGALRLEILVDDAFITFRYVANAHDGHGLVWNRPPFLPVEGYSNFSWALVLWAVWTWFGIEPPVAANFVSIACGLLLVILCARTMWRLRDGTGRPIDAFVGASTLACIVGNRTFLQWLTGGLETALFDLIVVAWVVHAFRPQARRGTAWALAWTALAAAAELTRADGLLFVAASIAAVAVDAWTRRTPARTALLGCAPLLAVAAHVLWRWSFYGEWLPNTYFAKVAAIWPESGFRFLVCFAIDNGAWAWLALALAWIAREVTQPRAAVAAIRSSTPAVIAVTAIAMQVGYWVVCVGGDHFEYRVLAHLVPLGALSATAMALRIGRSPRFVAIALLTLTAAGSFAWYQLAATEFCIPPRYDAVSAHAPAWLRPIAHFYDRHRLWLQVHMVGIRFRHGQDFAATAALFPERKARVGAGDDIPVIAATAVGWTGWVLPDVAVIDQLGLNDWVGARTPMPAPGDIALPPPLRKALLDGLDGDHDGVATRAEIVAACTTVLHETENAPALADAFLLLFGDGDGESLDAAAIAAIEPFYADLRLMAHDRLTPPDYVAAFDPNVSFAGREVTIRARAKPLRAADVMAREAEWRQRVRDRAR